MERIEYKCKQCRDTGWALTKSCGVEKMVLCYCHPLVKSGNIKALSGSIEIEKYISRQNNKGRK